MNVIPHANRRIKKTVTYSQTKQQCNKITKRKKKKNRITEKEKKIEKEEEEKIATNKINGSECIENSFTYFLGT